MDVPMPPPNFEVELHCSKDNSTTTGSLQFKAIPVTALDVKRAIQSSYSIPTCVQRLSYQSTVLQDGDQLDSSLRSGDTFHVTYMGRGECREVEEGVRWMWELIEALESTGENSKVELDAVLLRGRAEGHVFNLCVHLFAPWCTDVKYINKLHFAAQKGLDAVMKLYILVTSVSMREKNRHKGIENMCLTSIANFCETHELQKLALQYGARDRIKSSFLSTRLSLTLGDGQVPSETVRMALYTLCNLSLVSESQLPLARDKEVLIQAVQLCNSHALDCRSASVAACLLLYLGNSPAAHPYLAQPDIVGGLIEGCLFRMKEATGGEGNIVRFENESILMLYYTALTLAEMALGTPSCIPQEYTDRATELMKQMLYVNPRRIRALEDDVQHMWCTYIPYVNLLYSPQDSRETSELYILGIKALLSMLVVSLGQKVHQEILCKEGFLDYVLCLPSLVPPECQQLSRDVVSELARHMLLEPPSLTNLARAKLAMTHLGLDTVRGVSSVTELVHHLH